MVEMFVGVFAIEKRKSNFFKFKSISIFLDDYDVSKTILKMFYNTALSEYRGGTQRNVGFCANDDVIETFRIFGNKRVDLITYHGKKVWKRLI